jgi:hypothetical protein
VTIATLTGLCELRLQVRQADRSINIGVYHRLPSFHLLQQHLHFNIPRANYSQLWQNHYNEDYPASARSSQAPSDPPVRPPTPDPRMANDERERQRLLDRIDRLTYDGTDAISRFLKQFDHCRSKLLALDPPEDEAMLFDSFELALKNASPPPQRGVDGERYIGPATWLDRQPMSEVDTYEKLCVKLRARFSATRDRDKVMRDRDKVMRDRDKVMRELQRMTFDMRKTTVKEFAEAWEETIGSLELDELLRMEKFMQKMPYVILDEFQRQGNRYKWRKKTWQWLKEALIEADEEIRNPDPVFHRDRRDTQARGPGSHSDIYKDPQESAKRQRRMADELAKVQRERDQFKAESNQLREAKLRRRERQLFSSPERPPPERQDHDVKEKAKVEHQPEAEEKKDAEPEVAEPKVEEAPAPVDEEVPKLDETPAAPEVEKTEEPVAVEETPGVIEESKVEPAEEIPKAEETCAPDVSQSIHDEPQETETAAGVFEPVDGSIAEPAKATEEFAQSSGARESSNDGQHVQLPARLAASKVFIIKRFTGNRCHLDVKPFLPTIGHTLLENFRTEDVKLGLAQPPPCTTLADSEELYQVDVDITVKTSAGSRDDRSLHISTPTVRSAIMIHCKMVEVNGKHVASEYEILRLGPGPEPPPEHDIRSLDFGHMKLTLLMIDSWRTLACIYWAQNAHSRGQQHSLISYYVDKPDPDPEPPPGCLNSSPHGEDQGVGHRTDAHCTACVFL